VAGPERISQTNPRIYEFAIPRNLLAGSAETLSRNWELTPRPRQMDIPGNSFSLFVLYLVISGNFLAPLFSCRLRQFIESNMVVRHILGFLTLTFFVVVATKSAPMTYASVLGLSALFYGWFVLTTRMSLNFWFLVITLLGAVYMIHLYKSDLTSDTPTPEQDAALATVEKVLSGLAGAFTIIGFLTYYGQKKMEYGDKFSHERFFLGVPNCKGESPNVGFFDSLRGIFRR
jgi:hypothetical protein